MALIVHLAGGSGITGGGGGGPGGIDGVSCYSRRGRGAHLDHGRRDGCRRGGRIGACGGGCARRDRVLPGGGGPVLSSCAVQEIPDEYGVVVRAGMA